MRAGRGSGPGGLAGLVAARLAPLRIISAAWPLQDWLPCLQVGAHPDGGWWRVTVVCWHVSRAKAEDAASSIWRLLNGWAPPAPWGRVQARVQGTWQPAGLDRAWCRVDATTRWEGADAAMGQ